MSNCPGKAAWLWFLSVLWFWDWTYLGNYDDEGWDDQANCVRDKNGSVVWKYEEYVDVVVRLRYIHIFDNLIYVFWLRYFNDIRPYTSYLNSSEILTFILFIQEVAYTNARMKTHVALSSGTKEDEQFVISCLSYNTWMACLHESGVFLPSSRSSRHLFDVQTVQGTLGGLKATRLLWQTLETGLLIKASRSSGYRNQYLNFVLTAHDVQIIPVPLRVLKATPSRSSATSPAQIDQAVFLPPSLRLSPQLEASHLEPLQNRIAKFLLPPRAAVDAVTKTPSH
ncbi:hypothetical protein K458DRAFT_396867 [Lentithecium fluviatile CBS 122367]|uniref:Uncharacterized protein n=1 Tax=Lentithecium fluviatile CBS 122367 TaxID=1168545 RepID=A0A6G1IEC5_9PLEO|nr:hypothetical protein K458DRAFT_396867 [Lentithecium fluviatile CBS 122367]